MNLAQYIERRKLGKSEFGRQLAVVLGEPVPPQSVHRWTLPLTHDDYNVPRAHVVEAIEAMTGGKVPPNSWFRRPRKGRPFAVSQTAGRKAAAAVRRRRTAAGAAA
jgi:hypothetical protein